MNAKQLMFLLVALAPLSIPAQAAELTLRQALAQCQQQQDTASRLHCYDQLASTAQQPEQNTTRQFAENPQGANLPETTKAYEAEFGRQTQRPEEQLERIYATVTAVRQDARGHRVISFDNGQIWRQNSVEHYPVEEGQVHFIRRAALGSFMLGNDNNNRTTRVRRVN
ncbi:hypothetical protein ABC502_11920 [Alkalimonas sp. NCh-2]|uniref:hypothetical protein n=1 Tax=Alkalimonas sp. NCh-2 TaxID=3144846 RepID=UPI0031F6DF92